MFPVESLKFIKDLADKANPEARVLKVPAEPDHVYFIVQPGGELKRMEALLPPDTPAPADLGTLVRLAVAAQGNEPGTEIWYSRGEVVAVNGNWPRWRVTLDLTPSPQMERLIAWDKAGKQRLSQQELVIALRTLFAGCAPEGLLAAVRNVKTTKQAEVNSQIAQGKVSLGKSIVAEMAGTAAIPETVALTVPVFAQAAVPVHATVRVALDPDPQTEVFNLIVLPGDVEHAFADAEQTLVDRLDRLVGSSGLKDEQMIPLYRGTP